MVQQQEAAQWLNSTRALRRRVRAESLPAWFPLLVFGCVVLGAVPLYLVASDPGPAGLSFAQGRLSYFGGMQPAWYVGLYWLLSIPAGYGLSALFYRRHADAVGLADRSSPFIATGFGLFGALVALFVFFGSVIFGFVLPGNLLVRGMLPLLAISLALASLAITARSATLGAFATVFVGLTLVANLYNVENVIFRLGWTPSSDLQWRIAGQAGLAVCGIALLVAAGASYLTRRSARGASS